MKSCQWRGRGYPSDTLNDLVMWRPHSLRVMNAMLMFVWPQIVAFIVAMTGTMMLLYHDPDISPQIWNCSLILTSNIGAALFKVTIPHTANRPLKSAIAWSFAFSIFRSWVVSANTTDTFKSRLDKFWHNQDIVYDFRAQLQGTGSRSEVLYE